MLTPLMAKLVAELSDEDLDALTELINTERKRRWRLRRTPVVEDVWAGSCRGAVRLKNRDFSKPSCRL
jgi:hypothetical protein